MPRIEPLRHSIFRSHIHAHPQCTVFPKPRHHGHHQPVGDSLPAALFRYVDPLQLAVATKALRTMSRDKADHCILIERHKRHTFCQRLLWGMLTVEIAGNARRPVGRCSPCLRSQCRHPGNVVLSC